MALTKRNYAFTFYCSSIKDALLFVIVIYTKKFTFYCSSIKETGYFKYGGIVFPFTFYCSSIKDKWLPILHRWSYAFTFYCSSIKEKSGKTSKEELYLYLHSTVVLLKMASSFDGTLTGMRFTFYCSSIKELQLAFGLDLLPLFTFYCSSIKENLKPTWLMSWKNLHSTVVLLKNWKRTRLGLYRHIYILL